MYNSLSRLPLIAYNILVYLAKQSSAEDIWKMLKYNDYNCLSKPNLTFSEKMELIWKNGPQENFSVFLSPLVEDAVTESKSIMKIYDYYIQPRERYWSAVIFAFDFLYGGNMALIDYKGIPSSRGDVFIHSVLSTLNGVEIGGIGKLSFEDDVSRYSLAKATMGNERTFCGVQLYLTVRIGDAGTSSECDD